MAVLMAATCNCVIGIRSYYYKREIGQIEDKARPMGPKRIGFSVNNRSWGRVIVAATGPGILLITNSPPNNHTNWGTLSMPVDSRLGRASFTGWCHSFGDPNGFCHPVVNRIRPGSSAESMHIAFGSPPDKLVRAFRWRSPQKELVALSMGSRTRNQVVTGTLIFVIAFSGAFVAALEIREARACARQP